MADKTIRLRVVVQRNGLPDNNFMLPVSLEDQPTIAKLLEQVNNIYFPLESDQWGLEDYSVYRQASDGSRFECLHFSTIQSIFRDDDQVLIRPLQTDDLRRRRISGRYQISSDGKHLLDGVPFGRPMLRVPASRPPVYIPPRKKRRLLYDQEDSPSEEINSDGDGDGNGDSDGDGDGNGDGGEDEDTPMLLLTNGRTHANQHLDQSHADGDESDRDFQVDEQQSVNMEEEEDSPSEDDSELEADDDLAEELQALREENAALGETDEEEQQPVAKSPKKQDLDLEALDKISALQAAFPSAPLNICEKVLMANDGDLRKAYTTLCDGFPPELSDTATLARLLPGPTTSTSQPQKAMIKATAVTLDKSKIHHDEHEDDESPAGDSETEEVSAFVRQYDHRGLPPGSISSGKGLSHISFTRSKISDDSETTSATLMGSNGGKPSPEKVDGELNEDDETSSSGTSASSEDESEDEESGEDDDSDDSDSSDEGNLFGDAGSDSDSDEDSESNNENPQRESSRSASNSKTLLRSSNSSCDGTNDSDSGPEEATTKGDAVGKSRAHAGARPGVRHNKTGISDDGSDVSLDGSSPNDTTSDDTSDEDSSEAESDSGESSSDDGSSSDSGSDEDQQDTETTTPPNSEKTSVKPQIASYAPIAANQTAATTTVKPTQPTVPPGQPTVPPGHGKESTKSRNARRRAAQKAKKEAQAQAQAGIAQIAQNTSSGPVSTSSAVDQGPDNHPTSDQALFEAKRKALLDAIASGGVEVDFRGEMIPDDNSLTKSHVGSKRKRDDEGSQEREREPITRDEVPQQTPSSEPATVESDTSQKRRRVDMGAGRRLLFGALGLRNPKDKDDAEKVRAKLMEGVRPLTNHRLEQEKSDTKQPDAKQLDDSVAKPPSSEEDPDAWRDLITYRAVECCQEGIELSEPPFPFVQRWDPQQQNSWFHKNPDKRGGQGKRAQRNEAHFYQEENSSKKRKQDESFEWGGEGYDETFNGIEDDVQDENNIQLNYDDVVEPDQETNDATAEVSQFTDLDDLPSLPPDLSSLPVLRPGEVKPGMVITWKKWLCSAATRWQPSFSHFTGVVVRIDDDATGVEVCLAKRDRNLDSSQKRYDPVTGKRVYDKFEAPDLEEESDAGEGDAGEGDAGKEDEGYRTVSFADMFEPKILQHPFSLAEGSDPIEATSADHPPEINVPEVPDKSNEEIPAQPEAESHVTESPLPVIGDKEDAGVDARVESTAADTAAATGDEGRNASHSTDHQAGQGQDLIDQAGLSLSDTSQISSPSRQLHDTTSQATGTTPNDPNAVESSGYRGDVDTDALDTTAPLLSDPVPSRDQSSAPAFGGDDDEVITGTPKAKYAAKVAAPSSVGSVHSGRQLDYTMEDDDDDDPDSLRVTEADDEVHGHEISTILGAEDDGSPEQDDEEDVTTPTPSPTKLFSSDHQVTPIKATKEPSRSPSTPDSFASINTIFCTAKTSRQTQSPSKSQSQADKTGKNPVTRTAKDLDYEEAMRKLDEQSVDDRDEESSNIPDSFRRPLDLGDDDDNDDSQMSVDAVIKDEQLSLPKLRRQPSSAETKISPPPPKRAARKRLDQPKKESSSQFTLPPGTQVIDLLSSSDAEQEPEPQFTEHYADEDADGTWSPKAKTNTSSSLPKGPGWIGKVNSNSNKKAGLLDRTRNVNRSSTAPLSSHGRQFGGRHAGKGMSSSQGQSQSPSQSENLSSSLPELGRKGGLNGGGKARRKTSARF